MNFESESLDGDVLKITLAGRLDIQGTQEIDLKLTAHTVGRRAVIVDMSGVDFIASIGIRTLLVVAKSVSARGGKLVLLNPDSNVTQILVTTGIETLIPICRSLEEARSAVST